VTVLSAWTRGGAHGSAHRFALQCDGCFPPRFTFGDAETIRRFGWRFDDLEGGPHRCPVCPPSGARRTPPAAALSGHPELPNLIVIGAAKSGTTSLHRYLAVHPEIQMSAVKELRFFQDPRALERRDEYARFFDGRAAVRGEATPAYTYHPLIPDVPERIRATVPDARLIYVVRDPVERAIAAYAEARANDKEDRTADEALRDPQDDYSPYLAPSRYGMQAERFLDHFPREQLLVVHQRDLLGRRLETMRRIFRFLGVDEDFESPDFAEEANTRAGKRRRNWAGRALHRSRLLRVAQRLPDRPRALLLRPLRRLTSQPIEVAVSPDVRARLDQSLGDELGRLSAVVVPRSS